MVEQSYKISGILSLENDGLPEGESFLSILDRKKQSKQNELAQREVSVSQACCYLIHFERSAGGGGNSATGEMVGHFSSQSNLKMLEPLMNSKASEMSIKYRITRSLLVQNKMNSGSPIDNRLQLENSENNDTARIIPTGLIKPDEHAGRFEEKEEIAGARLYSSMSILHEETAPSDKKNIGNSEEHRHTLTNTQQFIKKSNSAGDSGIELNSTKKCELEYQFQRWNGDHSVRVSLPTELSRDGMIKLMPSDMRVADALSKNMDSKLHLITDVLMQQQKENGREHHHAEEEEE